ncbi:MAG TPA: dihydroneopterin aldolase [Candidatus Cloacimonadota bacterium]|nr:dihydroneopterin aldolase [Candidatus Cloacimonadota bacterium]HOV16480.1 dihydroneopterin aldolase [Candidatus Cloacimonadota bacterium]HQL14980.1 dihydroneopterin aldolase [Candidatus Cloacimonadota bacterium]
MTICLNDMVFYGFHGVFAEERTLGQRFIVSLELTTDDALDKEIRKLDDTVDYTKVYSLLKKIMETDQFYLLESVANIILDKVLAEFPLVKKAKVFIQKPSVAIQGILKSVELVMERSR